MSQQKKLEFYERVFLLRKRMKLDQVQFAQKLGVSDEYVSQIERGKRDPSDGLKLLVGKYEQEFQLSNPADSNSVEAGIALQERASESEGELWKRRAKAAEKQLADLRGGLRSLLELSNPSSPLSSAPLSEAQELARLAAGDDLDSPKKPK